MATVLTSGSLVMAADIKFAVTQTLSDGSIQSESFTNNAFSGLLPADADRFLHGQATIGTGSDLTFDFQGSILDMFGNTVILSKLYGFLIRNTETVAGRFCWVGNSNLSDWLGSATDKVKVGPRGCLFLCSNTDGYTVTATTADIFKINNPSGSNTVTVKYTFVGKA